MAQKIQITVEADKGKLRIGDVTIQPDRNQSFTTLKEPGHLLELEFNTEAWVILDRLALKLGKSNGEVIRQALILLHYCTNAVREGKTLAIIQDGQIEKEIILN